MCLTLSTPCPVACQAPLSMGFPKQEYWSGLSFPSSADLLTQGSNPGLLHCRWILYQLNQQASSQKAAWSHFWLQTLDYVLLNLISVLLQHFSSCLPVHPPYFSFFLTGMSVSYSSVSPIMSGSMLSKKSTSNKYLLNWKTVIFAKKICLFIFENWFSSVQLLSRVRLFATPWIAAHKASLFITNSWSSPKPTSIELVMPSSHLIFCRPLFLLPPLPPSIRVFSNESTLCMRWPKYWSFSFSIIPSKEHPGLISFRMDWLDILAVQGTLKSLLQHHSSKAPILRHSAFFTVQFSHPYMTAGKTIALTRYWVYLNSSRNYVMRFSYKSPGYFC